MRKQTQILGVLKNPRHAPDFSPRVLDISTQIENKWKKDTVLGIVKDSKKYSIKIRGRDKELIKKRFVIEETSRSNKRHNKRVVAIVYCYLLYKALLEFKEAKPLLICRDVRPERYVIHYLQKISNFFNNRQIMNREIKFRKRVEFETKEKLPKSLAGKYVRKVYQSKLTSSKILSNAEIDELLSLIAKIL